MAAPPISRPGGGGGMDASAYMEALLLSEDAAAARSGLGLGSAALLDSSALVMRVSAVVDGPTAVAHELDTSVAYVTAGAKLLSVRNNGVEKAYIDKDGGVVLSGALTTASILAPGASLDFGVSPNSVLRVAANGFYPLTDNTVDLGFAGGGFSWKSLTLVGPVRWGVTSSFPMLKRNGAVLQVRLADDSNYATVEQGSTTFGPTVGTGSGHRLRILGSAIADYFDAEGTPRAQIDLSGHVYLYPQEGGSAVVVRQNTADPRLQAWIDSFTARTFQIGPLSKDTPGAYTGNGHHTTVFGGDSSSLTADSVGGTLTLQSGRGRGAGAASSIIFQTPTVGASGSTIQSWATRWEVAAGGHILPGTSLTYSIGDATKRVLNVYCYGLNVASNGSVAGYFLASYIYLNGFNSVIKSPSNGVITLLDNAETSFARLQLGGTSASYPSWKRSGAAIHARLADDSAYAAVRALSMHLGESPSTGSERYLFIEGFLGGAYLSSYAGIVTAWNEAATRSARLGPTDVSLPSDGVMGFGATATVHGSGSDTAFARAEAGVMKLFNPAVSSTAPGGLEMFEHGSDFAAPAANGARIYVKDNGAGKTQLVVRFNTGAVQVIQTEP